MKYEILNRDNINIEKWDNLIFNSTSPRIYATSDYLDNSTSKNWKAIVFEDYGAALPLFEKNTILLKYLAQPVLSQQLGLFISKEYFEDRNLYLNQCLDCLLKNYKVGNLSLNEGNWMPFSSDFKVTPRTNYVLSLSRTYEKIYSNYSKSLRRNLKKISDLRLEKNLNSIDDVFEFYQKNLQKKYSINSKSSWVLLRIFKTLFEKNLISTYSVVDDKGTIFSQSIFSAYGKRITNLFGSSNDLGINNNSMTFLLDAVIRENAETEIYFDFEGSDVPGVKEFFKRFGPEEKKYPQISWDKTAGIYSFVKKIKNQVYQ